MSETLSPQDNEAAAKFYEEHGDNTRVAESFQSHYADIEARKLARDAALDNSPILRHPLKNILGMDREGKDIANLIYITDSVLHDNKRDYEANLWRAHEHKQAHLDEYIETARQEAEAQGVPISIETPKE